MSPRDHHPAACGGAKYKVSILLRMFEHPIQVESDGGFDEGIFDEFEADKAVEAARSQGGDEGLVVERGVFEQGQRPSAASSSKVSAPARRPWK